MSESPNKFILAELTLKSLYFYKDVGFYIGNNRKLKYTKYVHLERSGKTDIILFIQYAIQSKSKKLSPDI